MPDRMPDCMSAAMTPAGRFAVGHDHPSLPGHFPGRPVVPGVVLLDRAAALIAPHLPGRALAGVPLAKFLLPVLPGQEVLVGFRDAGDGRVPFRCEVGGAPAAVGTLLFG